MKKVNDKAPIIPVNILNVIDKLLFTKQLVTVTIVMLITEHKNVTKATIKTNIFHLDTLDIIGASNVVSC
jgi:hypothetical protein